MERLIILSKQKPTLSIQSFARDINSNRITLARNTFSEATSRTKKKDWFFRIFPLEWKCVEFSAGSIGTRSKCFSYIAFLFSVWTTYQSFVFKSKPPVHNRVSKSETRGIWLFFTFRGFVAHFISPWVTVFYFWNTQSHIQEAWQRGRTIVRNGNQDL